MQRRCQFDLLQYRGCPLGIIGGKAERLRGRNTFKWYIAAVVFSSRCCPPFTYSECKQNSVAQLCLHSCSLLACHLLSPSIMSSAERSGAAMELIIVWYCSRVLLCQAVRLGGKLNWAFTNKLRQSVRILVHSVCLLVHPKAVRHSPCGILRACCVKLEPRACQVFLSWSLAWVSHHSLVCSAGGRAGCLVSDKLKIIHGRKGFWEKKTKRTLLSMLYCSTI